MNNVKMPDNVRLSDDGCALRIIDQTLLPNCKRYIELTRAEDIFEAIYSLRVRGAPAIGIAAAYGLYVVALGLDEGDFRVELKKAAEYLCSARPTAVNLKHALDRMICTAEKYPEMSKGELLPILRAEADQIQREDIEMCRSISEYGLTLVKSGDGILTHCNAGPLATSLYGTGLGTLFLGKERGYDFHVYCDETRPLLQGARLTSYELSEVDIDVTLICDNMASAVMKQGKINAVFVGCDRVAANGDTANKIGTSGAAVLAKYYGIPFYVFCPSSTIDLTCKSGADIVIEERSPDEIKTAFFREPSAPANVKCYNPSFDVTDNSLITAIITEKGICRAPYEQSLYNVVKSE